MIQGLFPLLASIVGAGDVVYEKYFFNKNKNKIKSPLFVSVVFSFVFLLLVVFAHPFFGSIKEAAFRSENILLLLLVIAISPARNILYYKSFKREGLCEIQPFLTLSPLLTVMIAGLVYPEERRHWIIFVLAMISALALVLSHIRKRHLVFNKYIYLILLVVLMGAIENNITKELLLFYSPVAIYTIRSGFTAAILFLLFKPKVGVLNRAQIKDIALISTTWAMTVIFSYYGYQSLGIVYTSLILMLSPIMVMAGSFLFLKDKAFTKRNVLAMIVVLVCVIIAQFVE